MPNDTFTSPLFSAMSKRVSILSGSQRAEFEALGILKIEQFIPDEAISFARKAILSRFEALDYAQNGEWRLDDRPRSKWPDKGYSANQIGNKIEDVGLLLDEPSIKPIIAELLENAELDTGMFKRPQVLVTLPNEEEWFMPNYGWHCDNPRLASGNRPGVQIFILLSDIKAQGGGTLAVSGSHHLLNNGSFIRPRDITRQLRKHSFFSALMGARHDSIAQFQDQQDTTQPREYTDLSITEMIGAAGDVYFMDTRVIHSGSPNAKDQPRMMATHRFVRSEMVAEIEANR